MNITWTGTATATSSISHGSETRGLITMLRRETIIGADPIIEFHCGRIACVARHGPFEQFWIVSPHGPRNSFRLPDQP